jgi:hypothetical protein
MSYFETAIELWDDIKERFYIVNGGLPWKVEVFVG